MSPADERGHSVFDPGTPISRMALRHDLVNGLISLVIGVAITSYTADDDQFDRTELLLSVAVSSFLSGFFTSYFAE
jgi:hypothetical protein